MRSARTKGRRGSRAQGDGFVFWSCDPVSRGERCRSRLSSRAPGAPRAGQVRHQALSAAKRSFRDRPVAMQAVSVLTRRSRACLDKSRARGRMNAAARLVFDRAGCRRTGRSSAMLPTSGDVHHQREHLTRRCSRRSRAARPLPLSMRSLLRTVARKGRAPRPAAERGRYAYSQERTAFLQVVAEPIQ